LTARKTIDELLAESRAGRDRLTAEEAFAAMRDGAVLVDVRSGTEQAEQGFRIPGALDLPLSVVLWRLDPDEPAGGAVPLDARVILICRQGYSSSLAAAQLRALGFERATDVIGGAEAWAAAGLPRESARDGQPDEFPERGGLHLHFRS
jgi:rhodanese-related sulfurtransferase